VLFLKFVQKWRFLKSIGCFLCIIYRSYLILIQKNTRRKRAVSSSNCIPSSDSQSVSRASLTFTQGCYITAEILANDTKLSTSGGYEFTVGDGKNYNGCTNTKLIPSAKYDVWKAVTWIPKVGTHFFNLVLHPSKLCFIGSE